MGMQTGSRAVDDYRDMFQPLPAYLTAGGVTGPSGFAPGGRMAEIVPIPMPLPAYPAGPSPMLPNPDGDGGDGGGGHGNTTPPRGTIVGGTEAELGLRHAPHGNNEDEEEEEGEEKTDETEEETKDDTAEDVGEDQTKEEAQAAYEEAMAAAMQDANGSGDWIPDFMENNIWFSSIDDDNITLAQAAEEARNPWFGIGRRNYLRNKAELEARAAAMDPEEVARQAINAGMMLNVEIAMTVAGVGMGVAGIARLGPQGMMAGRSAASRNAIRGALAPVDDAMVVSRNLAIKNVERTKVILKHRMSGGGTHNKFNTDDAAVIRGYVKEALESKSGIVSQNDATSWTVVSDLGKHTGWKRKINGPDLTGVRVSWDINGIIHHLMPR